MTRALRTEAAFFAAALILSIHAAPYRLLADDFPLGDETPQRLAAGVGSTPYQYRVLVPALVRGATELHVIRPGTQLAAFGAIETVALLLLAYAFRRYVSFFIPDRVLASVAAMSLYLILPFNYFSYPFFPYDVPSVLFFTCGLILIYQQRWLWFFPLFAIATVNRETSIFLTVVTMFVLFDRVRPQTLAAIVASQAAIWIAVKAVLWFVYRTNPRHETVAGLAVFQLKVNAATLVSVPIRSMMTLATWGCLWLPVLLWHRRIRDVSLRRTLWTVPVFLAAMLVVGFVIEMRIYGELLPIVTAAFWVVFLDVAKERLYPARTSREDPLEPARQNVGPTYGPERDFYARCDERGEWPYGGPSRAKRGERTEQRATGDNGYRGSPWLV
jgi:hypothetical protein